MFANPIDADPALDDVFFEEEQVVQQCALMQRFDETVDAVRTVLVQNNVAGRIGTE